MKGELPTPRISYTPSGGSPRAVMEYLLPPGPPPGIPPIRVFRIPPVGFGTGQGSPPEVESPGNSSTPERDDSPPPSIGLIPSGSSFYDAEDSTNTPKWKDRLVSIFNARDFGTGKVVVEDLKKCIVDAGISLTDQRIQIFISVCTKHGSHLNLSQFLQAVKRERKVLEKIFRMELIVKRLQELGIDFCRIFEELKENREGAVCSEDYHPSESTADKWACALCTVDGQVCAFGDVGYTYRAGQTSMPFAYGLALELHGEDAVHHKVGREPSGMERAEIALNARGVPHNPLINAGAIACTSLIYPASDLDYRTEKILEMWQGATGARTLPKVHSAHARRLEAEDNRNRSLAFLLAESKVLPDWPVFLPTLSLYFMHECVQLTVRDHAIAAATLASGGVCPTTGSRVFAPENVRRILSLMLTCGMNSYSGAFCYRIGLPAKSSTNGALMIVVPGVMGIALISPRVDNHFNSVRGVEFSRRLVAEYRFHQFAPAGSYKKDPTSRDNHEATIMSVAFAVADGDLDALSYFLKEGVDLNSTDYDGRTLLHIACEEGHYNVAYVLLQHGALPDMRDRWGETPAEVLEDCHFGDSQLQEQLKQLLDCEHGVLYDPPQELEIPNLEEAVSNHTHLPFNTWEIPVMRTSKGKYMYMGKYQWLGAAGLSAFHYFAKRGVVTPLDVKRRCKAMGISDKRVDCSFEGLGETEAMDVQVFMRRTLPSRALLNAVCKNLLVIPEWESFTEHVKDVFNEVKRTVPASKGVNASYIPPLARANPELFAASVCTVHGQRFHIGDSKYKYTCQSTTKPFTYAMVKEALGEDELSKHIGNEPSGRLFNAIVLNKDGTPHNPYINAGAIMCCSLVDTARSVNSRVQKILELTRRACGMEAVPDINAEVFEGERSTANRNRCLSYFMNEKGVFPKDNDIEATLSVYFKQCSIELNTEDHSVAAATLASGGICPITNERVFSAETVQSVLSLMLTCGMYDFSGEFCYHIGLPAKSGVGGCVLVVVPNVMGMAVFSPPLDELGNSVRGVAFAKALVSQFPFHQYDISKGSESSPVCSAEDKKTSLSAIWAAYRGDLEFLQTNTQDLDLDGRDYGGRTALHVASCMGFSDTVRFLLPRVKEAAPRDRHGRTPLDEAQAFREENPGCAACEMYLEEMVRAKERGFKGFSQRLLRSHSILSINFGARDTGTPNPPAFLYQTDSYLSLPS